MTEDTTITYTVDVEGQTREDSFTTAEVDDERAGYSPRVAESYAQYLAVERFDDADPSTIRVKQMGEPHDQYDETGGVPL